MTQRQRVRVWGSRYSQATHTPRWAHSWRHTRLVEARQGDGHVFGREDRRLQTGGIVS